MNGLERARPGRENARDWLTVKMVECLARPMDRETARDLAAYFGAYQAIDRQKDEAFTLEEAKAWTSQMENEDGTKGPHWTFDQARQIMEERDIKEDPVAFWAALCMVYSDYSTVAVKYKLGGNIEFYIDLARAFLDDRDAPGDKLARYYLEIARG